MTQLFALIIFSLFLAYMTRLFDLKFTGQVLAILGLLSLTVYLTRDPVMVLTVFVFFGLGSIIDMGLSESRS